MSFNYTDKEEKNVQQRFWKDRRGEKESIRTLH